MGVEKCDLNFLVKGGEPLCLCFKCYVYLLDTGEEVVVTHPEYDPDATQLEPDDSDFNQDLLESEGT